MDAALLSQAIFYEYAYSTEHPDARRAVETKQFSCCREHWDQVGKDLGYEAVWVTPNQIDANAYFLEYPDALGFVMSGSDPEIECAASYWRRYGNRKGHRFFHLLLDHSADGKLNWVYAVTSMRSRLSTHLPKTLRSLHAAGFAEPLIRIDDGYGEFGNWFRALWELYLLDPNADRYTIFPDDVVLCQQVKQHLSRVVLPQNRYWSLCEGAQVFAFSNATVRAMLSSSEAVSRIQVGVRGNIRGFVADVLVGIASEFSYLPSLVSHVGDAPSKTFPGEVFDATTLS